MGWWLLRLTCKCLAFLRLAVNFFPLRLAEILIINFHCLKMLNINYHCYKYIKVMVPFRDRKGSTTEDSRTRARAECSRLSCIEHETRHITVLTRDFENDKT